MYIAPVGIANAAAPEAAYAEAIELTSAHQSSYGREAAGVIVDLAKGYVPFTPDEADAQIDDVYVWGR